MIALAGISIMIPSVTFSTSTPQPRIISFAFMNWSGWDTIGNITPRCSYPAFQRRLNASTWSRNWSGLWRSRRMPRQPSIGLCSRGSLSPPCMFRNSSVGASSVRTQTVFPGNASSTIFMPS